jgi:N-acyl-D-aspartate/D-glutamate deacylase
MADLVIFDPARISDRATRARPTEYSVGVAYVLVNGKAVILNGALTAERPGHVVRGPAAIAAAAGVASSQ